jgi:hypothetical protein
LSTADTDFEFDRRRKSTYGRRLFQEMSYQDTPEPPIAEMRFVDRTAETGETGEIDGREAYLPSPS